MMKSAPTARRVRRTISTGNRRRLAGRAAPGIGALVGARRQELVDQISFAAHDFDAVVAGFAGQLRAPAKSAMVDSTPRPMSGLAAETG